MNKSLKVGLILGLCGIAAYAAAQQAPIGIPNIDLKVAPPKGGKPDKDQVSASLQILAMLTVLSIAPAILILTTAFTRIIIIFSFLRSALGTPTIPPNQVIVGLSLFLTFFVMSPTYTKINDTALQPYTKGQIDMEQALKRAEAPIREFMLRSTYERDLTLFLNIRNERPAKPEDVKLVTLIPAFVISELKTAFVIGFYIFIPFLIIDLVVASGLMGMGMMMLPPTVVSLPAKLLVFILADGWGTLITAILSGYR
ncbi:MAG: flagellar type III secretion system pore protein FliP [Fimbriimonas sp.]